MNANECRSVRLEIDNAELGQRLSAAASTHLGACTACAAFREERTRLRELVGSLRPVSAPPDFDMRLRARIAREKDTPRQPLIFRFVMSTPAIAVAAVIVAILTGAIIWVNQRSAPAAINTAENGAAMKEVQSPAPTKVQEDPAPSNSPEVLVNGPRRSTPQRQTNRTSPSVANQSVDFSSRSAPSVQLSPDRKGEVSLTASENPMVLTIRDAQGGSRRVMLPPVTFGSQRLTGNRMPVSMNNSRDW